MSRAVGQPLVRFGIVRSFANSLPGGPGESAGQPATPKAGGAASIMRREGDILSFRSLYLDIGEIDVQTDGVQQSLLPPENCSPVYCLFYLYSATSPSWIRTAEDLRLSFGSESAGPCHLDVPVYLEGEFGLFEGTWRHLI